jgi:hypothetical protein
LIGILWGGIYFLPLIFFLILGGNQAHILVGNATPKESRYDWDLPLGVLPYFLDKPLGLINRNGARRRVI